MKREDSQSFNFGFRKRDEIPSWNERFGDFLDHIYPNCLCILFGFQDRGLLLTSKLLTRGFITV